MFLIAFSIDERNIVYLQLLATANSRFDFVNDRFGQFQLTLKVRPLARRDRDHLKIELFRSMSCLITIIGRNQVIEKTFTLEIF